MIQPDAKCAANGPKVNEVARAVNALLNGSIIIGDVNEPEVKVNEYGWEVVLPKGQGDVEIDVVDSGNTPAKRWFTISNLQGYEV